MKPLAAVVIVGGAPRGARAAEPSRIVAASPAAGLAGTWHGSFAWPGGTYWVDDGRYTLRINRDGTFSAMVTPAPGANNLAKASSWSGTVVGAGDRVTLRSSKGPSTTLMRSGDRLYGISRDPIVEVPIAISLERPSG